MSKRVVVCLTLLPALIALLFGGAFGPALALSRIKDLAQVEGVRQNQLVGYGLVVGLNGTGDTLNNAALHQAIADRDAGASRRQHARLDACVLRMSPP